MLNKKIKVIVLIMAIVLAVFGTSYAEAANNVFHENDGNEWGSSSITVEDPGYDENLIPDRLVWKTKDVWATVAVIVQIVAVACVVFAGLRYMFASADQKADVKQGLINLSIGAILVFSAITIIQFVAEAAGKIL